LLLLVGREDFHQLSLHVFFQRGDLLLLVRRQLEFVPGERRDHSAQLEPAEAASLAAPLTFVLAAAVRRLGFRGDCDQCHRRKGQQPDHDSLCHCVAPLCRFGTRRYHCTAVNLK
jgi:hypothetical protein